jgi:glucan endo-1,3-alpha-glucosidase
MTRSLPDRRAVRRAALWAAALAALTMAARPATTAEPTAADLDGRLGALAVALDARPAPDGAARPDRPLVFAHYMTCYFNSVEFYMQEIELAQRHGIDGFAMNCGSWSKHPNYIQATERMYEAARRLDTGFKLMMSPDGAAYADMDDMLERFYEHPCQFRWNGRAVISGYGGRHEMLAKYVRDLRAKKLDFLFVPHTPIRPGHRMAYSIESALGQFVGNDHMDGLFYFAIDGTVNDLLRDNATIRRVARHLGKISMSGVGPAYNSPNLRDFQGFRGYDTMWRGIVRDRPDWVEIVTWNDYNEDSNLMPWRWQRDWAKYFISRDASFLDATGHYARWFRAGRPPEITQDKIYHAYRNRPSWLRREWNPETSAWEDITERIGYGGAGLPAAPDQIHDDARDCVYVTTVLTAPAELTIELAGRTHRFAQPAGIAHVDVPLAAGVPRFTLRRDGTTLTAFVGRKRIIDEASQTKLNSTRGYHLANRTWTGGSAVGPVAWRIAAPEAALLGDAEAVAVGEARGVRNRESDESGFRAAVSGLENATYAVRVTYSNPAAEEARLTLVADGPPRGEGEYPYFIPLFLPPTAEGELATTSFLWPLYETTSFLAAVWRQNAGGNHAAHPLCPDQGRPVITAVELIKVEPAVEPERRPVTFPEMVPIPGGRFTMGADDTVPDEAPTHRVDVSPFAIGRFPVTNEEFERFDPEHRRQRDGFSWRDREPVIYVSWLDAVRYCNWLSEQAGLDASYTIEGNTVTFNAGAAGFRLPSEAEWEYVASGRGEGRRYPWGDDPPVAGVHGHFPGPDHFWPGPDPLRPNPDLPSDAGGGTMVVGTFPAGRSRDGVMDLAGNVCEWTNDLFHRYAKQPQANPHVWQPPGPHRSIRGSSFGYYGTPVRVTDREFNSPVYGGYIYIGFRVALPDAGVRRLLATGPDN